MVFASIFHLLKVAIRKCTMAAIQSIDTTFDIRIEDNDGLGGMAIPSAHGIQTSFASTSISFVGKLLVRGKKKNSNVMSRSGLSSIQKYCLNDGQRQMQPSSSKPSILR